MKKTFKKFSLIALTLLVISSIFIISCNNNEENGTSNLENSKMVEYGKTIPVSIRYENNKAYVGFIISAQWYTIDLSTSKRTEDIELITNSIQSETPLKIFLKENTNEIVKIEEVSTDDISYFKSIYGAQKEESLNRAAAIVSVIPNQTTLTSLFNTIKNNSCGTTTAPSTCITFRYAVDGCYARAHKVRQILSTNGYDCQKQFVYGNLRATTGTCCVSWGYHVAVLVQFKNASGVIEERIIDPSLFPSGPVLPLTWRNACKNTSCGTASITSFANAPGNVYYRNSTGSVLYDNNYVNTNCVLTTFKNLSGCSPSPAPSTSACGF